MRNGATSPPDAAAARRRPRTRQAATALVIAVDIDRGRRGRLQPRGAARRVGRGRLRAGARTRWSSRTTTGTAIGYAHFRGGDLLAVVDPTREGEGAGTALLEWAERRGRERGVKHAAPGRRRPRRQRPRAAARPPAGSTSRSYWRMERDSRAGDDGAARPARRRGRGRARRCTRSTRPRSRASAATGRSAEDAWTQREFGAHGFDAALGRVAERDGAPVGFALARRWEDGHRLRPAARRPPGRTPAAGLGGTLLTGVFAAARAAGRRQVQLNVASDNPERRAPVRARGDVSTLARRRVPEAAARLGAAMGAIPINIADHVGRTPMVQLTRLSPARRRRRSSASSRCSTPAARSRTASAWP